MIDKFSQALHFFMMAGGLWGLGMSEPLPRECAWCAPALTCFSCQAGVPPALTSPVNVNKWCVFCGTKTERKVNFPVAPRQVGHRGDADTYPE